MRYPKKKPWMCSVSSYASGTNFCHNTLQKIEPGTCEKCYDHYFPKKDRTQSDIESIKRQMKGVWVDEEFKKRDV